MTKSKPTRTSNHRRRNQVRLGGRLFEMEGVSNRYFRDFSHRALTTSWPNFIGSIAVLIVMINSVFALLYSLVDGAVANVASPRLASLFYFSVETLSTVGYGDMHPQNQYGHVIASIESFTGIFCIAVMTGLIFSRFSLPRARILFASSMIVSRHEGKRVLEARIANERHNYIVDARATLWFLRRKVTSEGRTMRGFDPLPLLRAENPTFALSWSIFHVIDETSLLHGLSERDFADIDAGFILSVTGYDDSSAQIVNARHIYSYGDVRWNHRFSDILRQSDGVTHIDYSKFHETLAQD